MNSPVMFRSESLYRSILALLPCARQRSYPSAYYLLCRLSLPLKDKAALVKGRGDPNCCAGFGRCRAAHREDAARSPLAAPSISVASRRQDVNKSKAGRKLVISH